MKKVYLVKVAAPNKSAPELGNNKYYRMEENGDGTWTARYGRVGGGEQSRTYPMSRWDKMYRSKLRKGYEDVTELQSVGTSEVEVDHHDPLVSNLLRELYEASHGRATKEYNLASFGSVTPVMLEAAQEVIDEIALEISDNSWLVDFYRDKFLHLYTIIPRSMKNVEDYLPSKVGEVPGMLENEQDTLESLRGQIVVSETNSKVSLLDAMGITIEPINQLPPERQFSEVRFRRGFEVSRTKSDKSFKEYEDLKKQFLYHGSRSSNWLSILESGLQIRPAANGTNFGRGIYFAEDYRKSRKYTDAYMGVYEVAVGSPYYVEHRDRRLSLDNIEGDSVKASGKVTGHVEYVIFRPQQCKIRYLLDVR